MSGNNEDPALLIKKSIPSPLQEHVDTLIIFKNKYYMPSGSVCMMTGLSSLY